MAALSKDMLALTPRREILIDAERDILGGNHNLAWSRAIIEQNRQRLAGRRTPIRLRGDSITLTATTPLPDGHKPIVIGPDEKITINIGNNVNGLQNYREADSTFTRCTGGHFENIIWDGGNVRTSWAPYVNSRTGGRAFTLRGPHNALASVNVINCEFNNFNDLPFWIASMRKKVLISRCDFWKCKDPGILYNRHVHIADSNSWFSADNAWSVSRSNGRVTVKNCFAYAPFGGLFIGGVDRTQAVTSTATLSGAAYTAGSILTLTIGGTGSVLYKEQENSNITLRAGGGTDVAVVRVTSVASPLSATCVALEAVPAGLQAIATSDWSDGPYAGTSDFDISGYMSRFSGGAGIFGNRGVRNGHIHHCTLIGSGMKINGESYTTGNSVVGAANKLKVADASAYIVAGYVCIDPFTTDENHVILGINSIDLPNNELTLSGALPRILVNADVYYADRVGGVGGITLVGGFETAVQNWFVQDIIIDHNTIIDSTNFGIRIGSSSGSGRDVTIEGNRIKYLNNASCIFGSSAILLTSAPANQRAQKMHVNDNILEMPEGVGLSTFGIRYQPQDATDNNLIRQRNNVVVADTLFSVVEVSGGTDVTYRYNFQNISTRSEKSLAVIDRIGSPNPTVAVTDGAGVMTLLNGHNSITTLTTYNVVSFVWPDQSITREDVFYIRKATATGTVSFIHDANKIRTPGGIPRNLTIYGGFHCLGFWDPAANGGAGGYVMQILGE